ncbi:MAG: Gfo/Idh/MocA family oxidoreductase [Treponemataceae bacterium]
MIKIGIIGCGSITQKRHAPEYARNPDAQIVGFFDPKEDRAKLMADTYKAKIYPSAKAMFDDKTIDAVSVCTYNKYHAALTIEALNAGKHVLCEKPMATTAEEAKAMIEAAKKSGKFLMIGHNQRLAPAHAKAKAILATGELGKILSFRTAFGHRGPEFWSADQGPHTWFFKKDESVVGTMGDLGVHKADLIRWLIGDEIAEVKAYVATIDKKNDKGQLIEVDDNALCLLKSKSGILGTLCASWTSNGDEDNGTTIFCTNGVIKMYDNPDFPLTVTYKNREKAFYKLGAIQTNESQSNSGVIDLFIQSLKTKTPPAISGDEGFKALKIILACLEASKTGGTVKIDY